MNKRTGSFLAAVVTNLRGRPCSNGWTTGQYLSKQHAEILAELRGLVETYQESVALSRAASA